MAPHLDTLVTIPPVDPTKVLITYTRDGLTELEMHRVTRHQRRLGYNATLGNRFVGIVVAVGIDVEGFVVGDAVVAPVHEVNGFDGGYFAVEPKSLFCFSTEQATQLGVPAGSAPPGCIIV